LLYVAPFGASHFKSFIRLNFHCGFILQHRSVAIHSGKELSATLEADELYIWKRDSGVTSND